MSKTRRHKMPSDNTCLHEQARVQYYKKLMEVASNLIVWCNVPESMEVDNNILRMKNVPEDITG